MFMGSMASNSIVHVARDVDERCNTLIRALAQEMLHCVMIQQVRVQGTLENNVTIKVELKSSVYGYTLALPPSSQG